MTSASITASPRQIDAAQLAAAKLTQTSKEMLQKASEQNNQYWEMTVRMVNAVLQFVMRILRAIRKMLGREAPAPHKAPNNALKASSQQNKSAQEGEGDDDTVADDAVTASTTLNEAATFTNPSSELADALARALAKTSLTPANEELIRMASAMSPSTSLSGEDINDTQVAQMVFKSALDASVKAWQELVEQKSQALSVLHEAAAPLKNRFEGPLNTVALERVYSLHPAKWSDDDQVRHFLDASQAVKSIKEHAKAIEDVFACVVESAVHMGVDVTQDASKIQAILGDDWTPDSVKLDANLAKSAPNQELDAVSLAQEFLSEVIPIATDESQNLSARARLRRLSTSAECDSDSGQITQSAIAN